MPASTTAPASTSPVVGVAPPPAAITTTIAAINTPLKITTPRAAAPIRPSALSTEAPTATMPAIAM